MLEPACRTIPANRPGRCSEARGASPAIHRQCFHCIGGQGHFEQVQTQVETIKALGFNTALVYDWGNLAPEAINGVLDTDPNAPSSSLRGL